MAHKTPDRAQETTTSTGTGNLTLLGATSKMQSFATAGLANNDTFWGLIEHQTAAEAELVLCTWLTGGIISRNATPLLSTNANAAVPFSVGTKNISCVAPGSKLGILDPTGTLVFPGAMLANATREKVVAAAIVANVLAHDLSAAGAFTVALNANVTTWNLTNVGAAGQMTSFLTQFTADGTPRTVALPANSTWISGTPTFTSTNGKRDLVSAFTVDGTNWLFQMVAQNF